MPTDLPVRKISLTASSSEGNLAFIVAVLLMLAISTIVLMHQDDDVASGDTPAQAKTF